MSTESEIEILDKFLNAIIECWYREGQQLLNFSTSKNLRRTLFQVASTQMNQRVNNSSLSNTTSTQGLREFLIGLYWHRPVSSKASYVNSDFLCCYHMSLRTGVFRNCYQNKIKGIIYKRNYVHYFVEKQPFY